MKFRSMFIAAATAFLTLTMPALAQSNNVRLLGQTGVDHYPSSTTIQVGMCPSFQNPPVGAVQFVVQRESVEVQEVVLEFGNNDQQSFSGRQIFHPGQGSGVVNLPSVRCIERIVVRGRTVSGPPQSRGVVQIFGYGAGPQPGGKFLLGRTRMSFNGQFDLIGPINCKNDTRAIQLGVRANSVEIFGFSLQYANGRTERVNLHQLFRPNTQSRVMELPGGGRCIRYISLNGRGVSGGPSPEVDFFGYR